MTLEKEVVIILWLMLINACSNFSKESLLINVFSVFSRPVRGCDPLHVGADGRVHPPLLQQPLLHHSGQGPQSHLQLHHRAGE